jgi:large repetitive protein
MKNSNRLSRTKFKIIFTLVFLLTASFYKTLSAQCPATISVTPSNIVCEGTNVILTASASSGSTFIWYKDGVSLDSTRNQLVVTSSGDYYVSTMPCGLNSSTKTITINPVPVSDFTYSPVGIICASSPMSFYGPSGSGLTYSWNFGDPLSGSQNTSTDQNPSHIFEAYGNGTQNFTVHLTTTNSFGCNSISTKVITVNQKPDVTLTDPTDFPTFTQCSFLADTFALTVDYSPSIPSTNTHYLIQWGDGSPDWTSPLFPSAGVLHDYLSLGSFTLNFTVTGVNGCQNSKSYLVFNGSNPSLTVGNPGGTTGCVPATFVFPIDGWQGNTPSTSYTFNFGDGTSPVTMYAPLPPSISHTYTTSSCTQPNNTYTFIVTAIASNPCGSTPLTIGGVQISEKPFAYFTVNDSVFCISDNVHFTNIAIPGCFIVGNNTNHSTNFTWNFGDGTTQTFTNISPGNITSQASANHIYTLPGIYTVSLKATNFGSGCCGDSTFTRQICISAQPNSSFTLDQMDGCKPLTVNATNTSTTTNLCNDRVYTWTVVFNGSTCNPGTGSWNFINGSDLHSTNPSFIFNNPGTYTIRLGVKNHCQTVFSSAMVSVKTVPTVNISSLFPICQDATVNPTAIFLSCYGNISGYNWTFPGGIPASSNQQVPGTISYDITGVYTITASATNECGTTSSNTQLNVKQLPVISATPSSQAICDGNPTQAVSFSSSLPGTTYSWSVSNPGNVGGVFSSGTSNPIPVMNLTNPGNTILYVTYTIIPTSNGCQGPPITNVITVYPSPHVSNNPLNQSVCSGQPTAEVVLTSDVAGTTFTWTASATSGITGFSGSGTATIPSQIITTSLFVNGTVIYTIIPSANGCSGATETYTIIVKPIPQITNDPLTESICSGSNTNIILNSNIIGTTYTWTSSCIAGTITGFTVSGSGNINDALTNTGTILGTIRYVIVPAKNGCPGIPTNFDVNVQPISNAVAIPPTQSICSGSQIVALILTSNVPGTSFFWSSTVNPPFGISGFIPSGTGDTIPSTTISDFLNVPGIVTYNIVPSIGGCNGSPVTAEIDINPSPMVTNNPMNQTICSGTPTVPVTLVSNVGTTTFTWTSSSSPGISGFLSSGTNTIPSQMIFNSGQTTGTVIYHIIPSSNLGMSCPGSPADYTIYINPLPDVSATPTSQIICSGDPTGIMLSSDVIGASFTWTVSLISGSVVGQSNGSGNIIAQQLTNTGIVDGMVRYTITTNANGCQGMPVNVDITVHPSPIVITTPSTFQTICSGDHTNIALSSAVTGSTFTWTSSLTTGSVTGYSDGAGFIIAQALLNTGLTPAIVSYTIHATANGCSGPDKIFEVTVNPIPVLITIPANNQSICSQSSTNIILNTNISGTTYSWIGNLTSGTITGFSSGTSNPIAQTLTNTGGIAGVVTYDITPSLASCYGSVVHFPVTVNPLPVVDAGPDLTIPCGTSDTLFGSVSGGTGSYIYSWVPPGLISSGVSTATAITTNLSTSTTFTFTVSDAMGCQWSDNATVNVVGACLSVNPQANPDPICNGQISHLTANAFGGSGNYTYSWTSNPAGFISSSAAPDVSPSISTVYTVIVFDGFTSASGSITVTVNPLPAIFDVTGGGEYCSGGTGVPIGLTGSQTGVSYQLFHDGSPDGSAVNGNNGALSFGNRTLGGIYTITATWLSTSCSLPMNGTVTISINPLPMADAGTDFSIPYGTNTSLNGNGSGGTGSLSYLWSPLSNIASGSTTLTPTTTNLFLNTAFTLTVTDSKGCTANDAVVVSLNGGPLSVLAMANPQTICNTGVPIQLSAVGSGGSGNYSFTWISNPAGFNSNLQNPVVNPFITTQYTVTINDGYNMATNYVIVTVNPLPALFIVTGGGEFCAGGTGLPVGLNGSEIGISYQLLRDGIPDGSILPGNGGSISFGIRNIAGLYTVNAINDLTTCSQTMTGNAVISINPLPVASAGTDLTIPFGTSTTLSGVASGGTGSLIYSWTPVINIASGGNTLSPLTTNLYLSTSFNLSVSDSKGCSAYDQVTVFLSGNPLSVSSAALPQVICNTGTPVQLTAAANGGSGSYSYSWSSLPAGFNSTLANPVVNPTQSTTYTVVVNDGYNISSSFVLVTVIPLPTLFTVTGGGEYCSGGTGLPIGLSGSETSISYQLLKDGTPFGSPLTGTSGSLAFGSFTISGTYTVVATNTATTCSQIMTGSVTISIDPLPITNAGNDLTIPFGTSTTLSGSASGGTGGLAYSWIPVININSGGNTLTPLTTNLYNSTNFTLTVSDTKGCSSSDQVVVFLSGSPLSASVSAIPQVICNDGSSVQLNSTGSGGSGSYTYTWVSNPAGFSSMLQNPIVTPNQSTIYTVTINDGYNTAVSSITVTVNPLPLIFNLTGGGEYCNGGTGVPVDLSGSQTGILYQLLKDGTPIGGTIPGTGNPITFGNQGLAGNYTVSATNISTTCTNSMGGSVNISINPLPIIDAGLNKIIPYGTSTTLVGTATGGTGALAYSWSPIAFIASGGNTLSPVTTNLYLSTTFTLTVNDAKSCSTSDQMMVILTGNPLSVQAQVSPGTVCLGEQIQLTSSGAGGSGTYTYSWVSVPPGFPVWSSNLQNPVVTPVQNTEYIVTINDGFNSATDSGSAVVLSLPVTYPQTGGGSYCFGGAGLPVGLTGSEIGVSYRLYRNGFAIGFSIPGTGSPISFGNQTIAGNYTTKGTRTSTGCINWMSDTATVIVLPLPTQYLITGGGSYPQGGAGVPVGLSASDIGVNYRLVHGVDTITPYPGIPGTGGPLSFGNQTLAGLYFVIAQNVLPGCMNEMFGSVTIVINSYPNVFVVFGGGDLCQGEPGKEIGLNGSEIGIRYTLRNNGDSIASLIGTGDSLFFGLFTTAGTYTITAINIQNGLRKDMNGTAILNVYPIPIVYMMIPSGDTCPSPLVLLNGSQAGINYSLIRGTDTLQTIAGTGLPGFLSFGTISTPDTYSITGINPITGCSSMMFGSLTIHPAPAAFTIIPQGIICAGTQLSLNGSEPGISYTLLRDDSIVAAGPISGTGALISFGIQYFTGTYRVIAVNNLTGCSLNMNGSSTLYPLPVDFELQPQGNQCSGVNLFINSSENGINYELMWNGIIITTLPGTGTSLHFGQQFIAGTYTVRAVNLITTCNAMMTGTTLLNPMPLIFNVIPSGSNCSPTEVSIDGSQSGVTYQLYRNGVPSGVSLPGTGSALTFGMQPSGSYMVTGKFGSTSCTDTMSGTITITPGPTVEAGNDTTICYLNPIQLQGHSTSTSSTLWTTSGDGIFSNPGLLNSFYTPGINDKIGGNVKLYLHGNGQSACSQMQVLDSLTLVLHQTPVAHAGNDTLVCQNLPVQLNGSATNYSGVQWASLAGDGTFDNPSILTPHYTPGINDYAAGFVRLKLMVNGTSSCNQQTSSDTVKITFRSLPTAILNGSSTICSGSSDNLMINLTGNFPWTVSYTDGTNNYTINNILSSPYLITVNPSSTTTYTLLSVNDNSCTGRINGEPATITVKPLPISYQMTASGGGNYCNGGTGVLIGLVGSQTSTSYQLLFGGTLLNPIVTGNGGPISFGNKTAPGIYKVNAVNLLTGCETIFQDSIIVSINPIPVVNFTTDSTCAGTPTIFHLSGPDIGKVATWHWNFGDGSFANYNAPIDPTHQYTFPGLILVTLSMTDTNGCTSNISHDISVGSQPISFFDVSAPNCAGVAATLTDHSFTTGSNYIVRWHWEFGDGGDTTIFRPGNPNITHIYPNSGNYSVTLVVTSNEGCMATASKTIYIDPRPIANFTPETTCQSQETFFTDLSQSGGTGTVVAWHWNFGDPASGTSDFSLLKDPIHIYNNAGDFNVSLAIHTSNGCEDSVIKIIHVNLAPLASFTADTSCYGSLTHFTDHSIANAPSMVVWDWNFGDGTVHSYTQNPSHQYPGSGIYTVTLTVTNSNGCTKSISNPIKVLAKPVAAFIAGTVNCAGTPVAFSDQSFAIQGYITRWIWLFGDGGTQTILAPPPQYVYHTYTNGGSYNVSLTVETSDGCESTVTNNITVIFTPIADFTYSPADCPGSTVHFTDSSLPNGGGSLMSWNWNFGDPGTGVFNYSTQQNPAHIYNSSGTFNVSMIVTNIFGCSDTITKAVTVNHLPMANFTADTVCKGNITHFTDHSTTNSGTITTWVWNFGDGSSNSNIQNPIHTYAASGTYNVSLTVTNSAGCTGDTSEQAIVKVLPDASFTYSGRCLGGTTSFQDQSTSPGMPVISWHWTFGDGGSSNLQNPVHIYSSTGTFTVALTITNSKGCTDQYSAPVVIFNHPTAAFSYNSVFCPAGLVTFTDHSTSNGVVLTNWFWTFEPGYNSNYPNPTFTYAITNHMYPVSLVVSDANGCTDTIVDPTVFVNPAFHFTFTADTSCVGLPALFTPVNLAPGDSLHNLQWTFGDPISGTSDTSSSYNPTHVYSKIGTFVVKLRARDLDNCVDSVYKETAVLPRPISNFTFDSIPHCDRMVVFYYSASNTWPLIDTLLWDFGDGTKLKQTVSQSATVTHHYDAFGNYRVSLEVINTRNCQDSISKVVMISCITASFTTSDSTGCTKRTATFYDNSAPVNLINRWTWNFGDGTDTTYVNKAISLKHSYASPGNYHITLIVKSVTGNLSITDTLGRNLDIHQTSAAVFTETGVCDKDTSKFINLTDTTSSRIVMTQWNFGEPLSGVNNTSSLFEPIHTYKNPGKYNVRLIVRNESGCIDTSFKKVAVYKHPTADFSLKEICSRQTAAFINLSKRGDTLINQYSWSFGDTSNPVDTSDLESPDYTFHQHGTFQVRLSIKDAVGCSDFVTKNQVVIQSPVSAFTIEKDVDGITGKIRMGNESQNATLYEWDFGDGKKSNAKDPVITYSNNGSYEIRLISWSSNHCTDTTSLDYDFMYHNLYVPNALSPDNVLPNVRIFKPIGVNLAVYHIEIFDSWGHLIWASSRLDDSGRPMDAWDGTMNGQLMPQGTYVWKISATFKDGTLWEGSDIGQGKGTTMGTVSIIR